MDLENVRTIRTVEDANKINADCTNMNNVAIVGLSFIGTEAAAVFKTLKKIENVTVLGLEKVPLERVLGTQVGLTMQRLHEQKGVRFVFEANIKGFVGGDDGKVRVSE
jgi:NAD(P)H-nitrite reductase large subunit